MSRLDLFVLCEQSRRKGQRSNFFTFQKRLRILNEDKIYPVEIVIFQREIWKNVRLPDVQLFEDRVRQCPVKIFLVSRLDLFALCVLGQRNGKRWNFFTFYKCLRIVNEGRIFSSENQYSFYGTLKTSKRTTR